MTKTLHGFSEGEGVMVTTGVFAKKKAQIVEINDDPTCIPFSCRVEGFGKSMVWFKKDEIRRE